jgi:hypothetical protein
VCEVGKNFKLKEESYQFTLFEGIRCFRKEVIGTGRLRWGIHILKFQRDGNREHSVEGYS